MTWIHNCIYFNWNRSTYMCVTMPWINVVILDFKVSQNNNKRLQRFFKIILLLLLYCVWVNLKIVKQFNISIFKIPLCLNFLNLCILLIKSASVKAGPGWLRKILFLFTSEVWPGWFDNKSCFCLHCPFYSWWICFLHISMKIEFPLSDNTKLSTEPIGRQ